MIRVQRVQTDSLADELNLAEGTELVSVNGRELEDFLDWEFLTADDEFVLLVRTPGGELVEFDVERPENLPLGVELEPPKVKNCKNRCEFCFVKGNPKGLRKALYLRDDDYRLSFRYGNFVTLTNLSEHDFDRIFEYGLTPLYVSVHATRAEVRRTLLGNPNAPDILDQLRALGEGGIDVHTQIVLRPGVNDGDELDRTLEDLYRLGSCVLSVSVVPVGLTVCNQKPPRRAPNSDECLDAINRLERYASRASSERGRFWAYGSDELYMTAQVSLPEAGRYDNYEQLENGVGCVRLLEERVGSFSEDLTGVRVGVATGVAMATEFPRILRGLEQRTGASIELMAVENDMYGPSVTTAGLLPGRSFKALLKNRSDLDVALIPAESVNEDGLFLDALSFDELNAQSPMDVRSSYWFGDAFGEERT